MSPLTRGSYKNDYDSNLDHDDINDFNQGWLESTGCSNLPIIRRLNFGFLTGAKSELN